MAATASRAARRSAAAWRAASARVAPADFLAVAVAAGAASVLDPASESDRCPEAHETERFGQPSFPEGTGQGLVGHRRFQRLLQLTLHRRPEGVTPLAG